MASIHEDAGKRNAKDISDLNLDDIPHEPKPLPQWVLYKLGPVKPNGKRDKFPIDPKTRGLAEVNNPETWGTLDEAISTYLRSNFDGIGFVFTASDPFVGTDLDECRDPHTGHIEPWALDIMQRVNSYTEASPSGTGLHILTKGKLPGGGGKEGHVEMYETGRFFTMTGEHIAGTPQHCEEQQEALTDLYRKHFPHKMNGNGSHNGKHTHADMSEAERQETLAELRDVLPLIPAVEHDVWLKVGMGLHSLDSGESSFDVWVAWSKTCPEKFDQADCLKRWRSFHDDGGITHKTIFGLAREHGWRRKGNGAAPTIERGESVALPEIIVNNQHLRDLIDESLDALRDRNTPPVLFERSGVLVRVQRDESNRPFIDVISEPVLRESLTRSADFIVESEKKRTRVSPPRDVVQTLHARGNWQFPALIGLSESPVLRADGTVLDMPGYDEATRLFYDPAPGLSMAALSSNPTQAQAQEAADFLISELLFDFPFCEPADKANMLACILGPIVRPANSGCVPLCLIDKPSPGSGATLLSDVVATITSGLPAAKELMPTGRNSDEEMRKRITSILMAAKDVVVLDNIDNALASSALSLVLTTPLWEDRTLSKNEMIVLPARTIWIATANNIAIRGDLGRRSYRVRIDPKQDRPWTRDVFKHADLLTWTREHRGELLHALLTMARAWFAAGKPKPKVKTPKIGGFVQWVDIVGGILAFSGVECFLQNLEELYSMVDEDAQQWRVFMETWHEQLGEQPITVAELTGFAQVNPVIMESLPEVLEWNPDKLDSSKKKLGKALKKRLDRHFGEYRLEQGKSDTDAKVSRWCVKKYGVYGV